MISFTNEGLSDQNYDTCNRVAHFINKFILNGPLRIISDMLGDNKMAEI